MDNKDLLKDASTRLLIALNPIEKMKCECYLSAFKCDKCYYEMKIKEIYNSMMDDIKRE